jgi:hypothetical protein
MTSRKTKAARTVDATEELVLRRYAEERGLPTASFRSIGVRVGLSHSTLHARYHQDQSPEAIEQRRIARAHNRLLQPFEERETAGFAVYRSMHNKQTSTGRIIKYVWDEFKVEVSLDWVTDFKKRQHLSSRLCSHASAGEMSAASIQQSIDFIERVRALRLRPEQMYAVDKIYIKDQPKWTRSIAPVGMCASFCELHH